ncbi:asparagine synthase (glutamine-hydrolyzing) [Mongoliitalea lutea]|uniref:asparagine synthase (glutamine-hydrolyzing) n=1 Tax=Mongoliitalea lutea TaxID=849756 RepID=A0A8J3CWE3_9BACT|nr:asparagine synthase (glutamine-hydrolyzing) [Mongoliitalea lutea]GHB31394.1 asparagine synthetase B [Mongoliitalea lutea]
MCGIAGLLWGSPSVGKSKEKLDLELIKHRGPDSSGEWESNNVWLGHTRLSILDLSEAGKQPFISPCGNYVLVYNGEIYNHLELRKEYLQSYNFIGHSDTETIMALFLLMKEKMLEKFVGMWALLLWDKKKQELFVSRDRFGQKPLYFRKQDDYVAFGSEMKLLGFGNEALTYNPTALADFLSSGNYGHLKEETFYQEISQFPAASFAYLSPTNQLLQPIKFWSPPYHKPKVSFGEQQKKQLKQLMVDSVLSQTISDVPIGITLSGGIDSSVIAGILAKHYPHTLHIFTAQTVGHKNDESMYVNAVLEMFDPSKIVVHRIDLSKETLEDSLDLFLKIQEEPFGDPSITAHGLLMKAAREAGIKVILGGQGADEIFSGYDHALPAILSSQLWSGKLSSFWSNFKNLHWSLTNKIKTVTGLFFPQLEKTIRLHLREKRENFIDENWIHSRKITPLASINDINGIRDESFFGIHLPHLLHYDDRNAMYFGVEGRTPFLDHRILEMVCSIDPADFFQKGYRKYLLREACAEYLPELVKKRKDKIGFFTPLEKILLKETDQISSLFENHLCGEMKKTLVADLIDLKAGKSTIIQILRIYRVMQILKIKQNHLVGFPN